MKPQILLIAIFALGCLKAPLPETDHHFCPIRELQVSYTLLPSVNYGTNCYSATFSVTYNEAGNPILVSATSVGGFGNAYDVYDYHFRYDREQHLTDYFNNFKGEPGAVLWDRYSYPRPRMIIDSQYQYGNGLVNGPPPTSAPDIIVDTIELDRLGRVVNDHNLGSYQYDARGNLVRPEVTYDDKINPYQTNYTWMFIARDFSVNNPITIQYEIGTQWVNAVVSTNRLGLPVALTGNAYAYDNAFQLLFDSLHIVYACDGTIPRTSANSSQ